MIIFPAQVLASVEHILQLLVGCIIDLSLEHLLVFCHLSLSFFSLYVCLIVQRTPLTLLPFALPRFFFRISWVVAAGAWEGGERYKGTSICRYLLDVPFHYFALWGFHYPRKESAHCDILCKFAVREDISQVLQN